MIVYDSTVSDRYAQALFNLAKSQGTANEVAHDAMELRSTKEANKKLATFLESPQFLTEDKERVIRKVFEGNVNPLILKLYLLLLKKGRAEYTQEVLHKFILLVEADQGIFEADISTATELSEDQKNQLKAALEQRFNVKLVLTYHVEPSLIGGVRFKMGDVQIDDTVKGKLEKLRSQLEAIPAA